jgi:hypothetical protein
MAAIPTQLGRRTEDDEHVCKDGIRRQEIVVAWWLRAPGIGVVVASGLLLDSEMTQ